ncbi:MAG: IS30 family transposase, partial [Pirellulales bacterium]|nr:IS30 family transposase [Pirellulales bacterium]
TTRVMTRRMRDPPPALRRSVTFDNGEDFAEHKRFAEACDLEVYFALPYRSWQRGANENTNGPPRKSLPKSCAAFDS